MCQNCFEEMLNEFLGIENKPAERERRSIDLNVVGIKESEPGIVQVLFADGSTEKAICDRNDTYELRRGIEVCVLHKLFGDIKNYNKYFDRIVKQYNAKIKADKLEKEQAELEIKKREKLAAKKAKRKEQLAQKKRSNNTTGTKNSNTENMDNTVRTVYRVSDDVVQAVLDALEKAMKKQFNVE